MAARTASARPAGSDLGARIVAALPAIAFAIFIVVQGGLVFAAGLLALGAICLHEYFELSAPARPIKLAGFLGLAWVVVAAHYGEQAHVLLAVVALLPVLFALSRVGPPRRHVTVAMAVTLFGVLWIGLALAHAILLRELDHGGGVLVDVLVGTFLGDTGAYFAGRAFGSRPLAPRISPNKTVEGLLGGMLTTVVAVWFAHFYQDTWLTGTDALLLGLGVALVAPIGDLFESMVKRDAGVKDTGRLFGAHGGALDRLDAALFTVVVGYYVWSALS